MEDAEALTRLTVENFEHLRPWMPWAQELPTLDEQRSFLQWTRLAWDARSDFAYAMLVSGEPAGSIGLHARRGPGTLEMGYWLAAAHTGRGYVTAAARALTEAAFALPGVRSVEIRCDEANRASAAIPARLGYRLVEVVAGGRSLPGESGRDLVWAVRPEDWRPGRPQAP